MVLERFWHCGSYYSLDSANLESFLYSNIGIVSPDAASRLHERRIVTSLAMENQLVANTNTKQRN